MNPDILQIVRMMVAQGARRFYIKVLADNDNSKNQPYMGNYEAVHIFPAGSFHPVQGTKRQNFHVDLPFSWLADNGLTSPAPHTKLIYYTDYPEVRLSGFLLGCHNAPNKLMNVRQAGRIMVFGIIPDPDARVIAYVAAPGSALANQFTALGQLEMEGVFHILRSPDGVIASPVLRAVQDVIPSSVGVASRNDLIAEMRRIHALGWINSKQLINATTGETLPCNASNCGGYTLEAELGITANGRSEPDWRGWEVKQYGVLDFVSFKAKSQVSVMVPNPDGGYRTQGFDSFMRRYGYPDKKGRPNRLNFGGQFRIGQTITPGPVSLTMILQGYDEQKQEITDTTGGIAVVEANGTIALRWSFSKIMEHWAKKHDHAVYVPSMVQHNPLKYFYGDRIRICETTNPKLLLHAFASQKIVLDPGLKLVSGAAPEAKERHQFRIKEADLASLYAISDFAKL